MESHRQPRSVAIASIGLAWVLTQMGAEIVLSQRPEKTLTFNRDIAPIIFSHCSSCHRPGQEAPFSLLSYSDVKRRAHLVAQATANRFMPPWKPAPNYGNFLGARQLTDDQIGMLRDWVEQGAVEGNPKDLPPVPNFSSDWALGQPDQIIKFAKAFQVPADGPDLYHCFIVPVNIPEDRYVTAFDFRPITPNAVHHAIVVLDPYGAAGRLESSPGEGYPCYGGFSFPVPGYLGIWTAGAIPKPEPPGVAKVLKKGSDLVVQIHFHPSGKAEAEQPSIGLYFQKEPPKKIPSDITLGRIDINIPPGDKHHRVTDYAYVMQTVDLIGIIPHAHKLCKEIKAYATLPDATVVPLLWIKDWDFNWQDQYRYVNPILLPEETRIDAEWVYDNSADNPRNPNNPPKRVTWGEGTNDEMAELHLEIVSTDGTAQTAGSKAVGQGRDYSPSDAGRNGAGASTRPRKVTYSRDIAPIIRKHCAVCHRPGEAGPFSLLTYEEVRKHARQIADVTGRRFMPPWLPEQGYEEFIGERDRRLSDEQIQLIQQWVEQGAPVGDPSNLPPQPHFIQGWQLGKPDLVLKMPKPYGLRAQGLDVYRNFVFPVPIHETRYVKAWEIRPGNKKIVHHCNVLIDRTGLAERLDSEDSEPGFGGMEIEVASERFEPQSHFIFWKPGTVPFAESDGMAWRVDPGTDLVLNTHMQPSGKPEFVQPEIALYFTDIPETMFPMLIELERDGELDIPPGSKDFVVTDQFKLPLDADVLGVYPHAHYLGKDLQAFATLPDGARKWLISIKNWDPNWQGVYRFVKPVYLPQGSLVTMRYAYDNSAENIRNPNRPPRRVVGGNQSTDEMAHLWLQVLPRQPEVQGKDARLILQKAMMEHDLEKYPNDFVALYNLAAVLQAEGKLEEAIAYYLQALKARPEDSTAENSVGTALQMAGKLEEAVAHYRRALELKANYPDAHYNLGNALLELGNFEEASAHLAEVLKAHTDDPLARERLAQAFAAEGNQMASQGKLDAAIGYFRRALELNPHDADACNNLGGALARDGKLTEAATYFERALRINPQHAAARRNLELAREKLTRKN